MSTHAMAGVTIEQRLSKRLYEHVFLPRRLPEREDEKLVDVDKALHRCFLHVARQLRDQGAQKQRK